MLKVSPKSEDFKSTSDGGLLTIGREGKKHGLDKVVCCFCNKIFSINLVLNNLAIISSPAHNNS